MADFLYTLPGLLPLEQVPIGSQWTPRTDADSLCVLYCRMMSGLSEWFWQERLWFPEGLGWADLEDRDGRVYAKARDLWVALPIALLFLIIRQIFERSVHSSNCPAPYLCLCSMLLLIISNIYFRLSSLTSVFVSSFPSFFSLSPPIMHFIISFF